MKRTIDLEAILAPFPGENPAGEDLRYTPVYDEIKEARRSDDVFDRGEWQREIKTSDWSKVIDVAVEALSTKTKDLQIAAWLLEALAKTEGFEGVSAGLNIFNSFLGEYWEHVYPVIEEGDLDFRAAPIEFMNDKLWLCLKEIPVTDSSTTSGFSWIKWQESRQVGSEADIKNRYGDVDENKKKRRDELISEGKLTAEDFDSAVALSSKAFYQTLAENITSCREEFEQLDKTVDEKFGDEAPTLADFGKALEDCEDLVMRFLKQKRELEPEVEPEPEEEVVTESEPLSPESGAEDETRPTPSYEQEAQIVPKADLPVKGYPDVSLRDESVWNESLQTMKKSGIRTALDRLLEASSRAPSVREKNRFKLLMAKLCLKAERPDLARPIAEELHALIEELQLERWESPRWIAEVIDALYQCLTNGEPSDDDIFKSKELLKKLCTTDVTKAIIYRN